MVLKKIFVNVRTLLILFLILGEDCYLLQAQDLPVVKLESVEIVSPKLSVYAIGSRTASIDSSIINLEAIPNLATIISTYTSLAIKSYGNGMLSTISFRGTGPSHTAVLWHGVNIAYPMLGQSDLSLLSMALSDEVKVQHGTSSALYGSGALGGTISLSNLEPRKGTKITISQWLGSFGVAKNRVSTSYANSKYFLKINTLWDQANNDFKFENTTKPGIPTETQQGANYKTLGSSIESGLKFNNGGQISLAAQYLFANRNLQPSMNANLPESDVQTDENIRVRTQYQSNASVIDWTTSYTFLKDAISFNGSKTVSDQHVIQAGVNMGISPILRMNLSADYTAITISSPFYSENLTNEERANIMGSILLNLVKPLFLSLNLRQSLNTDYKIPFTPSIGAEYKFNSKPSNLFKAKTVLSRGFRVPTLNERYWQPGGNPNLVPEDSYSAEVGFEGSSNNGITISYEVTAYRMWVENWILWQPQGSYWSPENIKYVDVYGIEGSGKLSHRIGSLNLEWLSNYGYTKSINRTGLDEFDRSVNKQLSYVPIHQATISSTASLGNWSGLINANFTGVRYTTADNENELPAYTLLNIRLSRTFVSKAWLFTAHFNVNNLLNTQYQSIENKAMPGISFLAGVSLSFKNQNNL